jgi:hypothetical protein
LEIDGFCTQNRQYIHLERGKRQNQEAKAQRKSAVNADFFVDFCVVLQWKIVQRQKNACVSGRMCV